MAFMGMFIIFLALMLIGGLFFTMVTAFIVGMATRKKKPIFSRVLICISAVIFLLFAAGITYIAMPKKKTIETPYGDATVMSDVKKQYLEAVHQRDFHTVDSLLTENPMLMYCLDENSLDALQYYAEYNDFEGVQLLLDHGAYFDNGVTLSHRITEYAIADYFNHAKNSGDDVIKMLKIMIDNGADVNYTNAVYTQNVSALFNVTYWAVSDDKIDEKELEAVRLVTAAGVDKTKQNAWHQTAAEAYLEKYDGVNDDRATLFFHEILDPDSMWGKDRRDTADNADY